MFCKLAFTLQTQSSFTQINCINKPEVIAHGLENEKEASTTLNYLWLQCTPIGQSQKVRLPCPFKHGQYTAFPWVMERDKSDPIQSSPIKVEDKLWWEVMSVCRELIPLSLQWEMAHSSSVPSRTQTFQALIWMSVSDLFLDSSFLSSPNFFDLRCCTSKIVLWQIQRIQHYKTFPAAELSRFWLQSRQLSQQHWV